MILELMTFCFQRTGAHVKKQLHNEFVATEDSKQSFWLLLV